MRVPPTSSHLPCAPRQRQRRKRLPHTQSGCRCSAATTAETDTSLTQRMFRKMNTAARTKQAGGAGGSTTFEALQKADAMWYKLRHAKTGKDAGEAPVFVREFSSPLPNDPAFDVVVCGGTLGIFLAAALQLAGLRVAVVERGPLRGRAQEWNISRKEIAELVKTGVLTEEEAAQCIAIEFNPIRAGFDGSEDIWVRDVLNLGFSPVTAIDLVRKRFERAGGTIFEFTAAEAAHVHPNGVALQLPLKTPQNGRDGGGSGSNSGSSPTQPQDPITARLLVDCMGHFSPIVRQARWGHKPEGVCLVVGACNRGHDPANNTTGDLIYTNSPSLVGAADDAASQEGVRSCQYFWEAFPSGSGPSDRTTYLFSYLDADERRPSMVNMMDDYWRLMPQYQNVDLDDIEPQRILFGFFPTYRASPLKPQWDRIVQVGDASGIQSPLSFGGFGALTRHLARLTSALTEAVQADALDRRALGAVNSYNPGLSGAWMLQRAMSLRVGQQQDPQFVNKLLGKNFAVMQKMGKPVLMPFLQDVPQFGPLALTMGGQMVNDPLFVPEILKHVGPTAFIDWFVHFIGLGGYTALNALAPPLRAVAGQLPTRQRFLLNRQLEAWRYGSGQDYKL